MIVTVTAGAAANSITIRNDTFFFTGTTLTVSSGVTLTVGNGSGAIQIGTTNQETCTSGTSTASLTVNGTLLSGTITVQPTGYCHTYNSELRVGASGSVTINGDLTGSDSTGLASVIFSGAGTINLTGNLTVAHLTTVTGSTVNYNGPGAQTAGGAYTYYNLTITKPAGTATLGGNTTVSSNLTITSGALDTSTRDITVTGTTTVGGGTSGVLTISSTTGTKTFNGLVTVNANGAWNESANGAVTFRGGITNNGTFTAGTGVHTFATNNQVLTGTLSIPNVTVSGVTLTNNNTLTVGTALSGTGGLTQAANATLNIGGTSGIATLIATNTGNTVNYYGAAQTAKVTTYRNLTLSGSSAKTFATTPTVNGVLSMEGTATVTVTNGVVTYGANATLRYNTATARTVSSEEWTTPFAATGGVMIESTGTITLNAAKVFSASVPLTVSGSFSIASYGITGAGHITINNAGILTANSSGSINTAGSFTVNTGGTYSSSSSSGFSVASLTVAGGSFAYGASGNISVTGAGGLSVSGGTFTFSGTNAVATVAVTNALTVSGTGSFTCSTSYNQSLTAATLSVTGGTFDGWCTGASASIAIGSGFGAVNLSGGQFVQGCLANLSAGVMTLSGGNYLNCNSTTAGGTGTVGLKGLTVNSGTFDYVGTGTITLGGDISNPGGTVRINGGVRSGGIPDCNSAKVSVTAGSTRTWSGGGNFLLADLALTLQQFSPTSPGVTVYGSCTGCTGTGGNGFTLNSTCTSPANPTVVRFQGMSTEPQDDGGVLVTWRTGYEATNLGFHVYRNGVRVTPSPIAGSALLAGPRTVLTAGNSYSWLDPDGTASSVYTVEDLDLDGTRTLHGPATTGASPAPMRTLRRGEGRRQARAGTGGAHGRSPLIREVGRTGSGDGRWISTNSVEVAADVLAAVTTDVLTPATVPAVGGGVTAEADPGPGAAALSQQYALARGRAVKLGVRQAGWYHVEAAALTAAGMPAYVSPLTLRLFVQGEEQALQVSQAAGVVSAIEFYGTGVDTAWADTQVYWLTWGSQIGQRVTSSNGRARGTAPTSFPFTVQWKPRLVYFAALQNGDVDNFFGPALDPTEPVTQALPVAHVYAAAAGTSTLQVRMQGVTAGSHVVVVSLNGTAVGTMAFEDQASGVSSFAVPTASLATGATLTLTAQGSGNDVTVVDTVALTYPHLYVADSDALRCHGAVGTAGADHGVQRDRGAGDGRDGPGQRDGAAGDGGAAGGRELWPQRGAAGRGHADVAGVHAGADESAGERGGQPALVVALGAGGGGPGDREPRGLPRAAWRRWWRCGRGRD